MKGLCFLTGGSPMSCRSSVKFKPRRERRNCMQPGITVVVIQSGNGLCILIWI
jgi:hypothetical protein